MDKNKPNLYILIGLPGSGKSTYAKNLDGILVSSDYIRECLYGDESIQGNPKTIFSYMHEITKLNLLDNRNSIWDATSTSKKNRLDIINKYKDIANIVGVYFDVDIKECLYRNSNRTRVVPQYVIERMNKDFEVPTVDEGFDKLDIISTSNV